MSETDLLSKRELSTLVRAAIEGTPGTASPRPRWKRSIHGRNACGWKPPCWTGCSAENS